MGTTDENTDETLLLSEASSLIEAGKYTDAEQQLSGVVSEASAPRKELLGLIISVRTKSEKPAVALQQLVRLMQDNKTLEGAHQFYSEVSKEAYTERASSLAFSHAPPAVQAKLKS